METIKLFNKWEFDGIEVYDLGLKPYINLKPMVIPRTNGQYHNTAQYKTKLNIVERIMNRIAVCGHKGKKHKFSSGHNTGKSLKQTKFMFEVLEEVSNKTKENPILVLVRAIENSAPREEVISIERAGARYAQAVDIGPQRRLDLVIRTLCQSAFSKSSKSKNSVVQNLANEIVSAYKKDATSVILSKKMEIEKMAASAK